MRNIVLGKGEVGSSLYEVLKEKHQTFIRDIEPGADDPEVVEVMNVCFPPGPSFEETVRKYQERYKPLVTIIHSSVPVGTTRRLNAVHSPIHGRHPNLSEGIRTFVKYLGGTDQKKLRIARRFLRAAGIKVRKVSSPETSEFSKLQCTTRLGWEVAYMKWVEDFCRRNPLISFEEVWSWHKHYNKGYKRLGAGHFMRSLLKPMPGSIGGHCVINNCKLMPEESVPKHILEANESYV